MSTNLRISDYQLINTDTRAIKTGDIFLALKGANFNGHNFIDQALESGAKFAYSQEEINSKYPEKVYKVGNTLETYQKLANQYRNLINPIVIAITGSSGKTTTKELLQLVLSEKFKVHYSEANFNNEIGVPKTILSMPQNTEVLILEMGMRGLGQIELLSKIAEPNIAIITNIGTAHIELLGSRENIKKAKLEICTGLKSRNNLTSTLIVDSKLYSELDKELANIKLIKFDYQKNFVVEGLLSEGLCADINAVYEIAKLLGMQDLEVTQGLRKYKPGKGRGEFIYDKQGNLYIDESYNSNPEAVYNSIQALLEQFPNDYRIAVLGDILESENNLVDDLFAKIKNLENENFQLIDGRKLDPLVVAEKIKAIRSSKRIVVLIKASRGAKFEKVLDSLI